MHVYFAARLAARTCRNGRRRGAAVALASALLYGFGLQAHGQGVDCVQLQQQIAQAEHGGGSRYAAAARRQAAELARTQAYAHQLGCDGFSFFGANPQCGALNSHIGQMQANLGQLQSAGGGARGELVARFNAYCRGQPQPPRSRGFFESLFGSGQEEPRQGPVPEGPPGEQPPGATDGGVGAHGGSQAVCVRSCDGGFFPLGISARRGGESLTEMCQALCPGTETAVFTRSPDSDIKSAVGLDGKPYMDLPNALKFQKNYSSACSCRQPGKSWAETLANAEEVLAIPARGTSW